VAERFVVPVNPGNAGGGKGPQFKRRSEGDDSQEIDGESITSRKGWKTPADLA
jgi:hypothetical protein